ncbi:hypothetical protein BC939DRAFT_449853 [Gamsiella multidivaricata]|uniref:uncharacterized protein n=1 Tax=Gamsiella multidivaricata TaxID=101098 RepID=UPI00221FE85E|nr:uncharacterized protein BC939DRAFT_449853 [Gamsiella multidivaricata]KAI7824718.1 hypothetical protein BC939DRAFT_449853 [Gamsiella multidivaricata]
MIPSSGLQQLLHHSGTASLAPDAFDPWIYSLFASSSDAIIACDLNGIVCAWNQGAHHIFGIPSKQSLGKDLNQLLLSTTSLSKSSCSTAATLSSVAPVAPAASAALAPPPLSSSSAPSEPELYPCTLEQLRALKGASIKRIVSRNVKDRTQHTFLESISPVYHQQQQQATEASECDSGSHSHGTNGISSGNRNGTHVVPNGCDYSHNYSHFKTWIGTGTGTETTSPALAGYSVILTDLSTLPNSPVSAVYSPQLQSSSSSLSPPPRPPPPPVPLPPTPTSFSTLFSDATPETVPPTLPATTGPAIDSIVSTTVTAKDTSTMTASIAKYTTSVSTPSSAALSTTAVCLSPAAEEDKQEESSFRFPAISIRPTTSREYSTDSGFDERSIASKSSTTAASLSSMGVVSTPPLPPTSVTGERPKAVRIPVVQLSPLDPVPGPGPGKLSGSNLSAFFATITQYRTIPILRYCCSANVQYCLHCPSNASSSSLFSPFPSRRILSPVYFDLARVMVENKIGAPR